MTRTLKDKLHSLMIAGTTGSGHMKWAELVSAFDAPVEMTRKLIDEVAKENGYEIKYDELRRFDA
jgi:hypothetical protein